LLLVSPVLYGIQSVARLEERLQASEPSSHHCHQQHADAGQGVGKHQHEVQECKDVLLFPPIANGIYAHHVSGMKANDVPDTQGVRGVLAIPGPLFDASAFESAPDQRRHPAARDTARR
jgi:hypothetical protein